MTCDDYQIAFDQQRAGVTPALAADVLATHIASCDSCKAYAALSEQVTTSMMTSLARAPAPTSVDSILREVSQRERAMRRVAIAVPLCVSIVLIAVMFGRGNVTLAKLLVSTLIAAASGGAIAYLLLRRRVRGLAAIGELRGGALVDGWRAEQTRTLRGAILLMFWFPLLIGFNHYNKFGFGPPSTLYILVELTAVVVLVGNVIGIRRMRRELANLRP